MVTRRGLFGSLAALVAAPFVPAPAKPDTVPLCAEMVIVEGDHKLFSGIIVKLDEKEVEAEGADAELYRLL